MTAPVDFAGDFHGLSRLRSAAARDQAGSTGEAARQFEALFVQMMLKSMREANAAFGEDKDTTYQDMYDQQIALEMTRGRGLGLAAVLERQLGGAAPADTGNETAGIGTPGGLPPAILNRTRITPPLDMAAGPPPVAGIAGASGTPSAAASGVDRDGFVRAIWPHARAAARELGVDPRALVAQAALESGWGSRQIRDTEGRDSHNLFGIKADNRWQGAHVTVTTLEYADGLPAPQRARFRAYPDLAAGFRDYVDFLKGNPRYAEALRGGGNAGEFADRLQSAGYATDPDYAAKIRRILSSPLITGLGMPLKVDANVPI